ncbi:hypothetical protein N7465_007353 [Penicillium sp. CMV-2018d]|nr:hypothetical protein N7465_007353 [Penicillium sp. CMV-2018d]
MEGACLNCVDEFPSDTRFIFLYNPFALANLEAMARQLQNPTLEGRETDNAGGYTTLMESSVETRLCKKCCVQKHTHEAKIHSGLISLIYTRYLLICSNPKCDNVRRKLDVSSVLLSTQRHWTVDWSSVLAIAMLSLKPRLGSKGNKSFVNATMARNVGTDHNQLGFYDDNTQDTQLTSGLQVENADPMWHRHVYDRGGCAQEYPEYFAQVTKSCNPLKPDLFLNMRLLGLSNILSKGHMKTFGFLVVALTMIQTRGWDKKGGDKGNPV